MKSLSRDPFVATPWTAAHQAPPSMGFFRQEYGSWLPFPSPKASGSDGIPVQFSSVAQSCPTLSYPMDCSLPGFSVHGIFQARVLEWIKKINSWIKKTPWRRDRLLSPVFMDFPGGLDSKESACKAGDMGSMPGLGRSPGQGHGNPL